MPDLATDALVRGLDSPSLRQAAGASPRDVDEARALFLTALSELGIDVPREQEALWRLVRDTAARIVAGDVSPYDGAAWIWRKAYNRADREGDLRIFVGLASEWEDHPNQRPLLDAAIVEEARILLERHEPRRWLKVMAREGCSPLWEPRTMRNIKASELPIDDSLRSALGTWAEIYDATFLHEGEGASGFQGQEDAVAFVDRGRGLVDRLQEALGPAWHVEYMPEPTRPPGLRVRPRRPRRLLGRRRSN